ncbi:hypothetical protein [Streptomyces sp. CoH17]|uniref:hypothetical protein n=1 Tax=Streptomyces sp. CoH17 TaxID=2992806 RepID=UPI00226E0882|nr:hypothetical protein [Streptomyces sp. CoH17]
MLKVGDKILFVMDEEGGFMTGKEFFRYEDGRTEVELREGIHEELLTGEIVKVLEEPPVPGQAPEIVFLVRGDFNDQGYTTRRLVLVWDEPDL